MTSVFSMRSDRLTSEITAGLELLTVNVEDGRVNQKVHRNKLVQIRDSIQDKLSKFSTVVSKFGDSLKAIPPDRRDEFKEHIVKYKETMGELCELEQDAEDAICKLQSMIKVTDDNITHGLMSKKRVEAQLEKDNIEAKLQADLKVVESKRKTLVLQAQLEKSKTDRLAIHQELVDNGQTPPPAEVHNHYQGPAPQVLDPTAMSQKCSKIPKLDMPKFNSTHEGWKPWWDRFDAEIHSRPENTEISKFTCA